MTLPVVMAEGSVISANDIERLVSYRGVLIRDVMIRRDKSTTLPRFEFTGVGVAGERISGKLVLNVRQDDKHVVVMGEIQIPWEDLPAFMEAEPPRVILRRANAKSGVDIESVLRLVNSIAKRGIHDLHSNPADVVTVIQHLTDISDLVESWCWFEYGPEPKAFADLLRYVHEHPEQFKNEPL